MTEIVKRQAGLLASADLMAGDQFDNVFRMAKALAASGMFKGAENVALSETQAFAKILIGRDMGLSPAQSLSTLHIVRGAVQVAGKQLLAWVKASDQYDYDVIERSPERGALQFWAKSKRTGEWSKTGPLERPGEPESDTNPPGPIRFTLAEAKAADLVKAQGGWGKYPANMCLWRCASIGVNLLCPDLLGGTPVYTEADVIDGFATEISAGEGDGSEPGWHGISPEHVEQIEGLLTRAAEANFAAFGDRATVQMRLNGQSESAVVEWIASSEEQLQAVESIPDAEVVPEAPS